MNKVSQLCKKLEKYFTPKKFEFAVIILMAITLTISILAAHSARPYTSDDVTTQTILQSWRSGAERDAVVGQNNYLIKIPFYLLHDTLQPKNTRLKLLLSLLLFNAVLLIGVVAFIRAFLGPWYKNSRLKIILAYFPTIWLLGLSVLPILTPWEVSRSTNFMNPNYRHAEIGLALLFTVYFVKLLRTRSLASRRQKITLGAVLLGMMALLNSDPYFIYTMILPLAVVTGVYWLNKNISSQKALVLMLVLGVSAAGSLVIGHLVTIAGLESLDNVPKQFITSDQLVPSITNTVMAHFKQFSADIWGKVVTIRQLPMLFNMALLALSLYGVVRIWLLKRWPETMQLFLALIIVITVGLFTLTTNNSSSTDRYIVFAIFAEVFLLSSFLTTAKIPARWLNAIAIFLGFGIILNTGVNVYTFWKQSRSPEGPNQQNYRIIEAVRNSRVTKGYAPYWDSVINTYLANNSIHFLQATCADQQLRPFDWVINRPEFTRESGKSFYLYSKVNNWSSVGACTPKVLEKQLAIMPEKKVQINETYTLYIYDTDISALIR